jgi:hypothetical protein
LSNITWLTLTDYATKYRVSISTLRRRIKAEQMECFFREGRYLVKDVPLEDQLQSVGREESGTTSAPPKRSPHPAKETGRTALAPSLKHEGEKLTAMAAPSASIPPAAESLVPPSPASPPPAVMEELKRTYMKVLQEKETQIVQLKEELADLQTLVRVLEEENERLKANVSESAPIDSWLRDLDLSE